MVASRRVAASGRSVASRALTGLLIALLASVTVVMATAGAATAAPFPPVDDPAEPEPISPPEPPIVPELPDVPIDVEPGGTPAPGFPKLKSSNDGTTLPSNGHEAIWRADRATVPAVS